MIRRFALLALLLLLPASVRANDMHPPVVLLDASGVPVLQSGAPVSTMESCGACHDTAFITRHNLHAWAGANERFEGPAPSGRAWDSSPGAFGRWLPMFYRVLSRPGDAAMDLGVADWIRVYGFRHTGGGPAFFGRDGQPLSAREAGPEVDPETHVFDPVTGAPRPWDWQASGLVESNCFLCHLAQPDNHARVAALASGQFAWAATATLAGTGLVGWDEQDGRWAYVRGAFAEDGTVPAGTHGLRTPDATNCGQCHGQVHLDAAPLVIERGLGQCCTEATGQIFSPQRLSSSGVNLQGREELYRPWDIHAERLLDCTACHHALNNPAYYSESAHTRPSHQPFEARKLGIAAYLRQPSHNLAKGRATQATVADHMDDSMRTCGGCHDPLVTHEWLPNREQHLRRLSCEACHIPRVFAPARQVTDWTVLVGPEEPRVEHRGVRGDVDDPASLVTGYLPVLLPREEADGERRMYPYNLLSTWFWASASQERPALLRELRAAFFAGEDYHPAIRAAFDTNGDGRLDASELVLDTEGKQTAVAARLVEVGLPDPVIRAEVQPFGLHHGVATKEWVNRDCRSCHGEGSRLGQAFPLAELAPGGVRPVLVGDANAALAGAIREEPGGGLAFVPDTKQAGLYVLGYDRSPEVDWIGLFLILGTLLGVGVHGGLRVHAARRRGEEARG